MSLLPSYLLQVSLGQLFLSWDDFKVVLELHLPPLPGSLLLSASTLPSPYPYHSTGPPAPLVAHKMIFCFVSITGPWMTSCGINAAGSSHLFVMTGCPVPLYFVSVKTPIQLMKKIWILLPFFHPPTRGSTGSIRAKLITWTVHFTFQGGSPLIPTQLQRRPSFDTLFRLLCLQVSRL